MHNSLYVVAFEPRDEFFLQDYLQGSDPGSARTFYTDVLQGAKRFRLQADAAFIALLLGGRVQRIVIVDGEVKPALIPIPKRAPIAERTVVTAYEHENLDVERNI